MTEQEAIQIVEGNRELLQIDTMFKFDSAEKAIVECEKKPNEQGPAADRIAWIIVLSCRWGIVTIHIDDRTGEILAVRRNR